MSGLALARVGEVLRHPLVMSTAGIAGGTAIAVGATLGSQYAYDDRFNTAQSRPHTSNHVVGIGGGVVGLAGMAGVGMWSSEEATRRAAPGVSAFAGFGIGALAGAYLVAPIWRRMNSEG